MEGGIKGGGGKGASSSLRPINYISALKFCSLFLMKNRGIEKGNGERGERRGKELMRRKEAS